MSGDDRRAAPPHELVGPLGQVIDPGGGFVPGLAPTPVPGALGTASPGLAATAVAPNSPVSGPDDPRVIALAIERIAGELLGGLAGTSAAPVPLAPATALTASHVQLPGAPGAGPAFVPAAPVTTPAPPVGLGAALPASASGADDSSVLASAIERLAGEMFGGLPHARIFVAPAAVPTSAPAPAAGSVPVSPEISPPASTGSLPVSPGIAPVFAPSAPIVSSAGAPSDPAAALPAAPPPGLSAGAGSASLPFPASIGSLSVFDVIQLPMLDSSSPVDAEPYFLPSADAVDRKTDRDGLRELGALGALPYEHDAQPAPIRNLGGTGFDPYAIRRDFPILEERVHGKRLVWLDNAATTQKPRQVIDRLSYFYEHENSNIHRGAHTLAARATDAYESGRESVRRFLNAGSTSEILFVRGATEGINLVAQSWGRRNVAAGDEIVLTHLEHHANIVPWQQLCAQTGARLRIAPVDDRGDVILDAYERLLGPRTRLVAFPQVSNALGTVTPAREMIEIAHRHGALVLLDGAQAVSHMRVDVQLLDCDFYVFSGHKVFAPTGIGAVFGKRALLEAMPPWQGGGNMIQDVTFERTTYQQPPWRFEAGTGSIGDAVGLGAALDYLTRIGIDNVDRYEHELLAYAEHQLATVPGLHMIGTPRNKAGVLSFVLDGQRTEDVGGALDKEGIAVRSGHHCAQPILRRFGVEATVRASLAFYNICEDIDALVDALRRLQMNHR